LDRLGYIGCVAPRRLVSAPPGRGRPRAAAGPGGRVGSGRSGSGCGGKRR
jgi:hypothetical protein